MVGSIKDQKIVINVIVILEHAEGFCEYKIRAIDSIAPLL